jgi:hypothetical protein
MSCLQYYNVVDFILSYVNILRWDQSEWPICELKYVAQWSSSMIRALGKPGLRGVPGSIPGWALFNY